MGIEEARAKLGDLVLAAQQHGTSTRVTRNGKRAAVIVPDKPEAPDYKPWPTEAQALELIEEATGDGSAGTTGTSEGRTSVKHGN